LRRSCGGSIADFISVRDAAYARGSALAKLDVQVPDGARQFELEEQMSVRKDSALFLNLLKPALQEYDYVIVDHPANIELDKKCQAFSWVSCRLSSFICVLSRPVG